MDGNTSSQFQCSVYALGHVIEFDPAASGPDKSVYSCPCGATELEYEDAGTGC